MVNKNYILLAGLCSAMALQPAFAQESAVWSGRDMTYRGQSYDALDSAYIPESRMEQQRDYLDYKYAFPAKPRNMWELGVNLGMVNMWGDITSKTPFNAAKPLDAVGFGLSLRKAWGYALSWRLNYNFQNATGHDYRGRSLSTAGSAWNGQGYAAGSNVYGNYKFRAHELTLQLVGATNNINFHKAKNTVSFYGFVGAGAFLHQTFVATKNASGSQFDFASLTSIADNKERGNTYRDWLADSDFGTIVADPSLPNSRPADDYFIGEYYIDPVLVGGVGVQFKLGDRVSLQIEDKISWSGLDYLDGIRLDPTPGAGLSPDKDILNYASVGLGFNLGNKSKRVAPLWWVNPLDHVYNELADPRHMRIPDVVIADSDGDGVADQFDKCPDTPNGVAVDAHGCPLDTDGDGVPDYRDKELITPTKCQPVNADGIGDCPCDPKCVTEAPKASCSNIISAGSISFSNNSASLSSSAKSQLAMIAAQMNQDPTCVVVFEGNTDKVKMNRQRSWDRVNNIINYMADELQISRSRFIFKYEGSGSNNSVNFRPAMVGEKGNTNVLPPHPHLGSGR